MKPSSGDNVAHFNIHMTGLAAPLKHSLQDTLTPVPRASMAKCNPTVSVPRVHMWADSAAF